MKPVKWMLVDCSGILHAGYHSTGTTGMFHNDQLIGTEFGFVAKMLKIFSIFREYNVILVLDSKMQLKNLKWGYVRNQIAPLYKVRVADSEKKKAIIKATKFVMEEVPLPHCRKTGHEADDLIAMIVKQSDKELNSFLIVSSDSDLHQIAGPNCKIYDPRKEEIFTEKAITEKYGFPPQYIANYKALMGDDSDNIKGIKGVGKVAATEYIKRYYLAEKPLLSAVFKKVRDDYQDYVDSLKLTRIPFPATPEISVDDFEQVVPFKIKNQWRKLLNAHNMKSISERHFGDKING